MKKVKKEKYLDLLATKLVEIKLSEIGFRYIPGIYPIFKRFKVFIEAKALIVKPKRLV